jgi:hypothetical protein
MQVLGRAGGLGAGGDFHLFSATDRTVVVEVAGLQGACAGVVILNCIQKGEKVILNCIQKGEKVILNCIQKGKQVILNCSKMILNCIQKEVVILKAFKKGKK